MRKPGRIAILWDQWHYFNKRFFGGKLTPPRAIRLTSARSYDGSFTYRGKPGAPLLHLADSARICLSAHLDSFALTSTLLHEMVHQYQLQVLHREPDHGKEFVSYCRWIERQTKFKLRSTPKP